MGSRMRGLVAWLGATAVAGPLGVVVQDALTFQIVWLGDGTGPGLVLAYVGVVLAMGLLTVALVARPVEWLVGRLLPRARWLAVPCGAALGLGLFSLAVSWELRGNEIGLLFALLLVFLGTRAALLAVLPRPAVAARGGASRKSA